MSRDEQLAFMQKYPSLMRICFMEYTINALMDWLPVEKEFLFESQAFAHHRSSMQAYVSILVAACDTFRQDCLVQGNESWFVFLSCTLLFVGFLLSPMKKQGLAQPSSLLQH